MTVTHIRGANYATMARPAPRRARRGTLDAWLYAATWFSLGFMLVLYVIAAS